MKLKSSNEENFLTSRLLLNNAGILRRLVVVFVSFLILEKILSNLEENQGGENRHEFSPQAGESEQFGFESSISGGKKETDGKLILLWNEYQMIGRKIYTNIFRRITDGKCPVSNCRF